MENNKIMGYTLIISGLLLNTESEWFFSIFTISAGLFILYVEYTGDEQ